MEQKSPALSELRQATRALHDQLEAALPVAGPGAGREEFLHYLQDLWGWLAEFEAQLWEADWPAGVDAAARSNKTAWIEADLAATDMRAEDIAALPRSGYRPDLDSLPRRFGIAYVIEGAQLGTRVLARLLLPALGGWTPRWLQGYGELNAARWRSFVHAAEDCLDRPEARREAAAAAREAFASLAAWFRLRQHVRDAGQPALND